MKAACRAIATPRGFSSAMMQRTATFLSLPVLLTLLAAPLRAEPALNPAIAPADTMSEIGRIVRREFYDPKGLAHFNASEARYRQLAGAQSGAFLPEASGLWLETLGATHTGRFTPDSIEYFELAEVFHRGITERRRALFPPEGVVTYPGIGMVPRAIGGKLFVAYVYDGSPAARSGVMVGDEILSVDGRPYAPIGSFAGKAGQTVALEVRRKAEASPQAISVPVERVQPRDAFINAIRASARVIDRGGKRIGYLRLWAFAVSGVEEEIMELLASEPLKGADALVLDMRGRWGGAPADAADIFVGKAPQVELSDRDGDSYLANARWRKPIVGIIDIGSRSGMEILAHGLKRAGVPLVGTRTAGAVVAGRAFMLADNSLLEVAVADVHVDGERLEGVGVSPTIEVPFDLRYADGADPQLERALAEITAHLPR
jgi:C-terminal processing protease CtpA/Prc